MYKGLHITTKLIYLSHTSSFTKINQGCIMTVGFGILILFGWWENLCKNRGFHLPPAKNISVFYIYKQVITRGLKFELDMVHFVACALVKQITPNFILPLILQGLPVGAGFSVLKILIYIYSPLQLIGSSMFECIRETRNKKFWRQRIRSTRQIITCCPPLTRLVCSWLQHHWSNRDRNLGPQSPGNPIAMHRFHPKMESNRCCYY